MFTTIEVEFIKDLETIREFGFAADSKIKGLHKTLSIKDRRESLSPSGTGLNQTFYQPQPTIQVKLKRIGK